MKIPKFLPQFAVILMAGVLAGPISGCATQSERSTDRSSDRPYGVGEYVSDSLITSKIKAKLATTDDVSALSINVDTDKNGVVVLSGTAKSKAEAEKAHSIAHSVEGVTKVINNIKIKKDD